MTGLQISTLLACLAVLRPTICVGNDYTIEDIQAELANVKATLATESGKVSQLEKNNAMLLTDFRRTCASLGMVSDGSHANQTEISITAESTLLPVSTVGPITLGQILTSNGSIKQEVIPLTVKSSKNPDGYPFVELTYQADTEADHVFWVQNKFEWIPDDYVFANHTFSNGLGKARLTVTTSNDTTTLAILNDLAVALHFGRTILRLQFNGNELRDRSDEPEQITPFNVTFDPSDIISSPERPTELLVSSSYDQSQLPCEHVSNFEAEYRTINASADPHRNSVIYRAIYPSNNRLGTFYFRPVRMTRNFDGFTYNLVLNSTLSSNGGMLQVRFGGCVKSRFVKNLVIVHTLYVHPGVDIDPFPLNRVELTYEYSNIRNNNRMGFRSAKCEAVGNPTPDLSLWRVAPNGTVSELMDEVVSVSQLSIPYYRYSEYHFVQNEENQKYFACRAVSGSSTAVRILF